MNFHINWAIFSLIFFGLIIAYSFWKAHRDPTFVQFNVFDLIMHQGRLDKLAVCFMAVFVVTLWVFVGLYLDGKLTEGYFATFGTMWVVPLTAKVVFGANSTQGMAVPGQANSPYGQPNMYAVGPYDRVPPYRAAMARTYTPPVAQPGDIEDQRPTGPNGA